jgi:hypothetical protein
MKLRNKGSQEIYDVPRSVGEGLIAAGIAVEVQSQTATKPVPRLTWFAQRGPLVGDYEYPPSLHFHCATCDTKGVTESQRGTAHTSTVVRHCGVAETCPEHVADTYKRLFSNWKSKSRKPLRAERVSPAVTDRNVLAIYGLKTREELVLAEQMHGNAVVAAELQRRR